MTDGTRRMAPGSVTRRETMALLGGVALGAATLGLCGCGSDAGADAKAARALGIDASALDTASLERA